MDVAPLSHKSFVILYHTRPGSAMETRFSGKMYQYPEKQSV
jgi:hypothetical protein